MEKTYNPQDIEQPLYEHWEKQGYFKPNGDESQESFCIMIPPPNVTGSLHMGHAFQQTIMDTMIRYQRMQGKNTLWQAGTDHAGIATQMVVERKIAAEEGKTRHDYGRDAFIDKIWQWKAESGGTITRQMRRLGNSVDWERERFTMDEGLSNAVKEVFVRLYKEDLIYRGKRLVNWDRSCAPRFPISKWKTASLKAPCGTSATRWPTVRKPPTVKITWWSPPPVRKPYSAIPAWPLTRKIRAIKT